MATLSEAEAHAYLGDLLVHSNRAEAHTYLQRALKLDPNLTMAHASLGMAYFREGRTSQAHASLERAVASNSQNYLAHYYYAFTLSRSGPNELPPSGYPPEVAAKIREHLQKAIALRPDFPETYNLLAFVSLISGQDIDQVIAALKQIVAASPGRHESAFMLGQLHLRKGDFKEGRELLEKVAKSNADEQVRKHAEDLLTQVRSYEEQVARYQTVRKSEEEKESEPATEPPLTKSSSTPPVIYNAGSEALKMPQPAPPSDPSFYLREVLRPPAAGETQLQGTLKKIECDGKGIVFVVQTATGLLRLRTSSFDDIELTTYDTSVKGEISCGPRNPENAVIVCYIPNSDKKIKADGVLKSIEFVPADFKLKAAQ